MQTPPSFREHAGVPTGQRQGTLNNEFGEFTVRNRIDAGLISCDRRKVAAEANDVPYVHLQQCTFPVRRELCLGLPGEPGVWLRAPHVPQCR
jgi:hypothetical protein